MSESEINNYCYLLSSIVLFDDVDVTSCAFVFFVCVKLWRFCVGKRQRQTIDELKQRLIEVWCGLEQLIVNMAIDHWRKRLRSCVRANGGHFEHSLRTY